MSSTLKLILFLCSDMIIAVSIDSSWPFRLESIGQGHFFHNFKNVPAS